MTIIQEKFEGAGLGTTDENFFTFALDSGLDWTDYSAGEATDYPAIRLDTEYGSNKAICWGKIGATFTNRLIQINGHSSPEGRAPAELAAIFYMPGIFTNATAFSMILAVNAQNPGTSQAHNVSNRITVQCRGGAPAFAQMDMRTGGVFIGSANLPLADFQSSGRKYALMSNDDTTISGIWDGTTLLTTTSQVYNDLANSFGLYVGNMTDPYPIDGSGDADILIEEIQWSDDGIGTLPLSFGEQEYPDSPVVSLTADGPVLDVVLPTVT